MSTQGLKTPPTFAGLHMSKIDVDSVEISDGEQKGNLLMADGSRREQRAYAGPGYPEIQRRFVFSLDYRHLAAYQPLLEARLAFAGPYELCLWKHVTLGYRSDGGRTEWFLPGLWRQALHVLTPPPGYPSNRYLPELRVGFDGAALSALDVDAAAYAGGVPAPGEVWFATGQNRFKLAAAPANGNRIILRLVPVYLVLTSPEATPRRYTEPIREPRRLVLEEA